MIGQGRIERTLLLLGVGALLLGVMAGCGESEPGTTGDTGETAQTGPKAKRYTHEALGFSIAFPETWDVKKDHETSAFIGVSPQENEDDPFGENVSVVAMSAPQDMSLEEFAELQAQAARQGMERFAPRGSSFETIDDHRAARIDYVHSVRDLRIVSISFILLDDQIAYAINCKATMEDYDRYRAQLLEIARSFRFVDADLIRR